jgi:hypothetical protein
MKNLLIKTGIILGGTGFVVLINFLFLNYKGGLNDAANVSLPMNVNNKVLIIAANGYGSTGSFTEAVNKQLQSVQCDNIDKIFYKLPQSNSAKINGQAINKKITETLAKDKNTKILVTAHSIAAIGAWNYKYSGPYTNNVTYLLYDPPYNAAGFLTPEFIKLLPNAGFLKYVANGGEITAAKKSGIANYFNTIKWTNGYKMSGVPPFRTAAQKKANLELERKHVTFEGTNNYTKLADVFNWAINYCPRHISGGTPYTPYVPPPAHDKPVIYLYPTQTEKVKVQLDYKGELVVDYPEYNYDMKGWEVTAHPDGTIIDSDGKEYSYIFWEGLPNEEIDYDLSKGFIVKGEDTVNFLQQTLSKMGLIPKEYNEFIVYWYPKMKDNKYNLIRFADEEYTDIAPLTITPEPDSMLRVFMVYKPLEEAIQIQKQDLKTFERKGFTVIEWGGAELK